MESFFRSREHLQDIFEKWINQARKKSRKTSFVKDEKGELRPHLYIDNCAISTSDSGIVIYAINYQFVLITHFFL